jgi:hypothetical protein
MVTQLPIYDDFKTLFELFESNKGSLYSLSNKNNNSRYGFPKYQGAVYGMTRGRFSGKIELSAMSKKFPQIYEELQRIGNTIGFKYNSIQINRNLVCPSHFDKTNVGDSMLISFGDYEGCKIVIDGVEYDAFHRPTIFNGSQLEHFNTPLVSGVKYSLVYFQCLT